MCKADITRELEPGTKPRLSDSQTAQLIEALCAVPSYTSIVLAGPAVLNARLEWEIRARRPNLMIKIAPPQVRGISYDS